MYKIFIFAKDKVKGKTFNKESEHMIKKIAWDAFKNTGDINTFLEFKQIESIENQIKQFQNADNFDTEQIQEKIKGEEK